MEIGEIQKTSIEKIKIAISELEGHKFVNIRTCYYDNESGEWQHTRKGVTIPPEKFEEFFKLLQKVQKELKRSSQQNERPKR